MTIARIYLPRPLHAGEICEVAEDQARYLETVLRMRVGDLLVVFNGSDWEYDAVICRTRAGTLALEIKGRCPVLQDAIEITLCQAIPKAEKMDGIIRHATELGVARIIPFFAERSIPRWSKAKQPEKQGRWQKIAVEASRQCGRSGVPEIRAIVSFSEMLRIVRPEGLKLIPWEEETERGIRAVLRDARYSGLVAFSLVIGPEGGLTQNEIGEAKKAGFLAVSLGQRVLRVETAALAVLAIVQYERGTLGGAQRGRSL